MKRWIGVDLDGTLAEEIDWSKGFFGVGKPIPKMVKRVKKWIEEGQEVRIMTARVGVNNRYSEVSKCWADREFAAEKHPPDVGGVGKG